MLTIVRIAALMLVVLPFLQERQGGVEDVIQKLRSEDVAERDWAT